MSRTESPPQWHLAQANVARMRAALDDPLMAGFVAGLDAVNALADRSPGFIWRYQTGEGDATEVRVFEDDFILFNMSVWASVDALESFVYGGDHLAFLRQRAQWFEPTGRAPLVLWWIEAGREPTVEEARDRLELLRRRGPTAEAFTFRTRFPRPGNAPAQASA